MLVDGDVPDEEHFGRLDGLGGAGGTYSLVKRSWRQKFSPSYNVPFAPRKLTCQSVRSLFGRSTFISCVFF